MKITIGKFKIRWDREYSLYYKRDGDCIYIGNFKLGNFFRFNKTDNNITIWTRRRGTYQKISTGIMLYIPPSKDDIVKILMMILKPMGLDKLDLKIKSRDDLVGKILLNDL